MCCCYFLKYILSEEPILIEEDDPYKQCPICMEYKMDAMPSCGHPLCQSCIKKVDKCPICRRRITKVVILNTSF